VTYLEALKMSSSKVCTDLVKKALARRVRETLSHGVDETGFDGSRQRKNVTTKQLKARLYTLV